MKNIKKISSVAAQLHAYRALKARVAAPATTVEPHPTTTDFFRNLMQMWENKHAATQPEKQLEEMPL